MKAKQNVHPRTIVAFVNDTLSGITQHHRTVGNIWDSLTFVFLSLSLSMSLSLYISLHVSLVCSPRTLLYVMFSLSTSLSLPLFSESSGLPLI